MRKIETWEDLKRAFEDYALISFDYKDCILFDNVIGFDKEGYLIRHKKYKKVEAEIWRYWGMGKKSYQQMYDIIKLMLE